MHHTILEHAADRVYAAECALAAARGTIAWLRGQLTIARTVIHTDYRNADLQRARVTALTAERDALQARVDDQSGVIGEQLREILALQDQLDPDR